MALFDNLVAAYKLSDLTDATGRGNTLTNNGAATFNTGKIGNAGYFAAGSSQYLSKASSADVAMGNVDFSIAAWAYLTSKPGNDMIIVGKDNSAAGDREYVLSWNTGSDRFRFDVFSAVDGDHAVTANNFGVPALNTWYCVIAKWDSVAQVMSISVNAGTPDTLAVGTTLQAAGAASFRIGARQYPAFENYWDGRLDAVHIWKKKLSAGDEASFYNAGVGVEFTPTVTFFDIFNYPFEANVYDIKNSDPSVRRALTSNVTVTETLSAADSETSTLTASAALTETLAAADSETGVLVVSGTLTETLAATDSQSATFVASGALTETLAASDSQSVTFVASVTIAEALTATDSQTSNYSTSVSLTETLSAADAQVGAEVGSTTVTESVTVADSQTGLLSGTNADLTESLSATDSQTANFTASTAAADTLAATDAQTTTLTANVSLAESVTASDSSTTVAVFSGAVSDALSVTDTSAANATLSGSVSESVAASDVSTTDDFNFVVDTLNAAEDITATVTSGSLPVVIPEIPADSGAAGYNIRANQTAYRDMLKYERARALKLQLTREEDELLAIVAAISQCY